MIALLSDRRAITLMLVAALTIMSNATISPALPAIGDRFADVEDAAFLTRLLVTAPSLAVAFLAPFAGMAADRFGARRQLVAAVILFSAAGSAGFLIDDLHVLLVSRLVLGVGVALMMTAHGALVGAAFDAVTRSRFLGLQMAATSFGGFLFLLGGGWLAGKGAQMPFLIYATGFLTLPLILATLSETRREVAATRAGAQFRGPRGGWQFTVAATALMAGLLFVLFYSVPTQLPFLLVAAGHAAPSTSGAVMSVLPLAGGLSALAYPAVSARFGRAAAPAIGFSVMAAGFFLLRADSSLAMITLAATIIGTGSGFILPSILAITLDAAPAHRRGLASGVVTTSIFLGQFLSPVVGQPVFAAFGFDMAFRLAAVAALAIGLLVAVFLPMAARVRAAT